MGYGFTIFSEAPLWEIPYTYAEDYSAALKNALRIRFPSSADYIDQLEIGDEYLTRVDDVMYDSNYVLDLVPHKFNRNPGILAEPRANVYSFKVVETNYDTLPTLQVLTPQEGKPDFPTPEEMRTGTWVILLRPKYWDDNYTKFDNLLKMTLDSLEEKVIDIDTLLQFITFIFGSWVGSGEAMRQFQMYHLLKETRSLANFAMVKKGVDFKFEQVDGYMMNCSLFPLRFIVRKLPVAWGSVLLAYFRVLLGSENADTVYKQVYGVTLPTVAPQDVELIKRMVTRARQ